MEKPFRQIIKEYFNFSRKDRNGLLALTFIILLLFIVNFIIGRIETKPSARFIDIVQEINESEILNENISVNKPFFNFNPNTVSAEELDSLGLPSFVSRNLIYYRQAGGVFKKPEDVRRLYGMNDSVFAEIENYLVFQKITDKMEPINQPKVKPRQNIYDMFDPNQVEKEDLLNMGFSIFQADNLMKYRKNGGRFYKPYDLLKIFGIDSALYFSVEKYIYIPEKTVDAKVKINESGLRLIELNMADSADLVKLYGIGPVFASRILRYRNLLGGFYHKRQLLEVFGFNEELYNLINDKIETDTFFVKKIRINFAEYSELIRHPYIKKVHAEAILNYRQKNGPYTSVEQIHALGLTDSLTYNRLRPYITCR